MKKKKSALKILNCICLSVIVSFSFMIFVGCGGGGGDGGSAPTTGGSGVDTTTGTFVDALIDGLTYTANPSSITGTTKSGGKFNCEADDTVIFSVGNVILGQMSCQEMVTPLDLVGTTDETDPAVTNIARFLQSLEPEADRNDNIITLTEGIISQVNEWLPGDFDPQTADLDNDPNMQALLTNLGFTLIDEKAARDNLRMALAENHIITGGWGFFLPNPPEGVYINPDGRAETIYLREQGNTISGTQWDGSTLTGSINGNSIQFTFTGRMVDNGCLTFSGTLNNLSIIGACTSGEQEGLEMEFYKSELYFMNFQPGHTFETTTPTFSWSPFPGADKYFIRIMDDDENHNCGETQSCHTIFEQDGISLTEFTFPEELETGNYRVKVFARTNSQIGVPDSMDENTYLGQTDDTVFYVTAP